MLDFFRHLPQTRRGKRMRRDFIELLHCPFSGSRFSLSKLSKENSSEVEYGVIRSEAGDFPIIDGILRLKIDEYQRPLVSLINANDLDRSLLVALETSSFQRGGALLHFLDHTSYKQGFNNVARTLARLKRPVYRMLTNTAEKFTTMASGLKSTSWANWQTYRFSMPAFMPIYPLLHLIEGEGPLLDFGSGLGHASFLISRRIQPSVITCADDVFSALFLARRFFVQDATFICLDGDYPLPFPSAHFSVIFSSDVVHLIDSKLSLTQEFRRTLTDKGVMILPHNHNKLSPVRFGKSLTPEGYGNLFKGTQIRIVPEDWLVDQFIECDSLDFKKEWTLQELNSSIKGLSIVASNDGTVFERYCGVWRRYTQCMLNPVANPLYNIRGEGGAWNLETRVGDPYKAKSSRKDGVLPGTISLELPSLDPGAILSLKESDPSKFDALAKKFIFIDVPPRFQ